MEGIAQPGDLRRLAEHDADDVESRARPLDVGPSGVIASSVPQRVALLPIHGGLRISELRRRARFHFDEHESILVPDHQIDLASSGSRAVVARHDSASVGTQVTMREIFAQASMIGAQGAPPDGIAGAVQQRKQVHFKTSNSNVITFPRTT